MKRDELAKRNAAIKEAWTPERRAALSAYRKAHPIGNRSKEWWDTHPEAKEATLARLRAGLRRWVEREGDG